MRLYLTSRSKLKIKSIKGELSILYSRFALSMLIILVINLKLLATLRKSQLQHQCELGKIKIDCIFKPSWLIVSS